MNKRRVKDLKTGKVYESIVEAVREAETCRSAVVKSLEKGALDIYRRRLQAQRLHILRKMQMQGFKSPVL